MADISEFDLPNGYRLKIDSAPLLTMFRYRQITSSSPESGGIMVGRILEENLNPIIDDISEPMEEDLQTRNRFIRRAESHQQYYNVKWNESGGRCYYLGEWHTHPEMIPTPSAVDTNNWKRIVLSNNQDIDYLLFVIVGIECLAVWQAERLCKKKVKIYPVGRYYFCDERM